MHSQGIDALFFTTEAEMRYFTGFRTLFWQSPTRPWFLVVPVNGKPIAVIPQIGAHLMASTWIDDIRVFSAPHPVDDGTPCSRTPSRTSRKSPCRWGGKACFACRFATFSAFEISQTTLNIWMEPA